MSSFHKILRRSKSRKVKVSKLGQLVKILFYVEVNDMMDVVP